MRDGRPLGSSLGPLTNICVSWAYWRTSTPSQCSHKSFKKIVNSNARGPSPGKYPCCWQAAATAPCIRTHRSEIHSRCVAEDRRRTRMCQCRASSVFFFKKTFAVNDVKTFAQIDEAQQRDLPLSVGARIWSDNDSNAVSVIESESVLGWG